MEGFGPRAPDRAKRTGARRSRQSRAHARQRQVRCQEARGRQQVGRWLASGDGWGALEKLGALERAVGGRAMPELSVAVFATDNDQPAVLQVLVDGTSVARTR